MYNDIAMLCLRRLDVTLRRVIEQEQLRIFLDILFVIIDDMAGIYYT